MVSNPPYIAGDDLHLTQGDLRFEPRTALTDDHDGLDPLRKLVSDGPRFLASGAWLLTEHGYDQAEVVRQLMRANSFTEVQSWRDLAGIERITGGRGPIFTDR